MLEMSMYVCVRMWVFVYERVCMCVCPSLRLQITSDKIWTSCGWLNNFCSFSVCPSH